MKYQFPFGETVKRLEQQDRAPKKVFVLGVYASAVHARWVNSDRTICQAMAVASEPRIFWNGDKEEALQIISRILVPEGVGKLVLPSSDLNGPSAKTLDEKILAPLGVTRQETWLCDMLPESRINPRQNKVIVERYNPLIEMFGLNPVTVPLEDGRFCNDIRQREITEEIIKSKAEALVLLGDMPIKQYLGSVCDVDFKSLHEYTIKYGYGAKLEVMIASHRINVLPIAHPRQIGRLGCSSTFWYDAHQKWINEHCSI